MKTMMERLNEWVSQAFEDCGYERKLGVVTLSNRPDLCDYQCDGAFRCAKLVHQPPLSIAQAVARQLGTQSAFSKVEAVPPGFVNLTLSDEMLIQTIQQMMREENAGIPTAERPETILLDYGGPNVAKPLHIGHLRAAIIGEALKRLMRLMGHRVIADVHLGDWGLQIGLVIAELSERFPDFSCFSDDYRDGDELPGVTAASLSEIYPSASKRSKTDEAFSEKAHRFTLELQQRRPGFIALWKRILEVSVRDLRENYEKLGVSFDLWYGESDADAYVPEVLERLAQRGLLQQSDGAKIVEVALETDRAPVPPAIIVKSDGAANYETTDIATILQRQRDFAPSQIWYVVDKRQELHFVQVFRVARRAGIVPEETGLLHLGFGTMNGRDGKPYKTRDGGVMRLSDMIETVTAAAAEKMESSAFVSPEKREETARKIGVAAIKFGDLINHRMKDYVFDLDKFLSFEGKTGSYLLYTLTRIQSILRKADGVRADAPAGVFSAAGRGLMLKLIGTGDAFLTAAREKAPNLVCENAYQIASAFSQFYHDNHILTEPDSVKKSSWLCLCGFVQTLLTLHLDVLGIETVDMM